MPRWLLLAFCSTHVRGLTAPQFYDSATKAPAFYKLVARGGGPVFASNRAPNPWWSVLREAPLLVKLH